VRDEKQSFRKLKDLTEKQIVKELRRTSSDPALNGQSRSRIQRANGAIKQRIGYFQQAEKIAQGLTGFKDSLYNEQAQGLVGKVQRKIDGRLKDLTEKQIVKELRRTSSSSDLNRQSNARIQRANGAIKQRLGYFQQAEKIAKVQVNYSTGKAAREYRERMGLSSSALVISNKLKKSPKD